MTITPEPTDSQPDHSPSERMRRRIARIFGRRVIQVISVEGPRWQSLAGRMTRDERNRILADIAGRMR